MNYFFVIIIIITLLADNVSLSIIALNYHDLEFNRFLENIYLTQYFHYNLLAVKAKKPNVLKYSVTKQKIKTINYGIN